MVVSQFVIDFKNGHRPASILAAKMVAKIIGKHLQPSKKLLKTARKLAK